MWKVLQCVCKGADPELLSKALWGLDGPFSCFNLSLELFTKVAH